MRVIQWNLPYNAITCDPVTYTNWITGRKSNYAGHTVEDC